MSCSRVGSAGSTSHWLPWMHEDRQQEDKGRLLLWFSQNTWLEWRRKWRDEISLQNDCL